jgi:Tfp pilus assembly protein PilV
VGPCTRTTKRFLRPTLRAGVARGLRGFTLAESLIASVVLAAAVIGIGSTLNAAYQQGARRTTLTTSLSLAQQLMEEIAAKPIDLPSGTTNKLGWPAVIDRRQYDTVDDYNGYTDTSGSVTTQSGEVLNVGDGLTYTRSVSVTNNALLPGLTAPASDFLLVTVSVSTTGAQPVKVSQILTKVTFYR